MKEALTVLKQTESYKTPGSDGLPHDFYLKTWKNFGEDLIHVMNNALFNTNSLSESQYHAIITILPKDGYLALLKKGRSF